MRAELLKILRDEVLKGIAGGWKKFAKERRELAAAFPNECVCTDLELLHFLKTQDLANLRHEDYFEIRLTLVTLAEKNLELETIFVDKILQICRSTTDDLKKVAAYVFAKRLNKDKTQNSFPDCKALETELFTSLTTKTENTDALIFLAYMYDSGTGVDRDSDKVMGCYSIAADKGSARAQHNLGLRLINGAGIIKNVELAIKYFKQAAEQEYAAAEYELGVCYSERKEINTDKNEAAKWFRKAAYQGNVEAYFKLGQIYEFGEGLPSKDENQAIEFYQKAAEQGFVKAQLHLGRYFMSKYQFEEAAKWRSKTALRGDEKSLEDVLVLARYDISVAEYTLGLFHLEGDKLGIVDKNPEEAVIQFQSAAEKGHADAQLELGNCYYSGNGIRKDRREAARWYKKAAMQENIEAQFNLGVIYSDGSIATPNIPEAYRWWLKAAERGHAAAQYNVGQFLESKNERQAAKWYQRAAEQGHVEAQYKLGQFLQLHKGGLARNRNDTAAAEYFKKAAEQGHTYAKISLSCWRNPQYTENSARYYSEAKSKEQNIQDQETLSFAASGFDISEISIAVLNSDGTCSQRNGVEAFRWLKRAAELQNDKRSQEILLKINQHCAAPPTLRK